MPINPSLQDTELLGQKVHGTLTDIPFTVDMLDVFRDASHLQNIVEEVISLNIKNIWTQLEVIDTQAIQYTEEKGVRTVVDKCPAKVNGTGFDLSQF